MDTSKITRALGKTGLALKKKAPGIMLAGGIALGVTTVVIACNQTFKVNDVITEYYEEKQKIEEVKNAVDDGSFVPKSGDYTDEDYKKDEALLAVQTGVKILKLYAPAIATGVAAIFLVIGSHHSMKKANASLALSLATTAAQFKKYREGVVEEFGTDVDKAIRLGLKKKEVECVEETEKGEKKSVKQAVYNVDTDSFRMDDENFLWTKETSSEYDDDEAINLYKIRIACNQFTDYLRRHGYLYMDKVLDFFGLLDGLTPKQRAKYHTIGWIYDEKDPIGDNYVDITFERVTPYDTVTDGGVIHKSRFPGFILHFNHDGNIMMPEKYKHLDKFLAM